MVDAAVAPEGLEPEPDVAAVVFGDRIDIVRAYCRNLAMRGEELGLIGPLELPRLWTRHIVNCGLVAPLLRPGRVGDVGSGAGLPGLVLAATRPDVEFVLIEPMERRVAWLMDQVEELGLSNATVVRARSEEVSLPQPLDQVTARAVSAFRKLLPLTAPLLRPGGELVLMKGRGAAAEIEAAQKEMRKHKVSDARVEVLGEELDTEETRVIRARVRAA